MIVAYLALPETEDDSGETLNWKRGEKLKEWNPRLIGAEDFRDVEQFLDRWAEESFQEWMKDGAFLEIEGGGQLYWVREEHKFWTPIIFVEE